MFALLRGTSRPPFPCSNAVNRLNKTGMARHQYSSRQNDSDAFFFLFLPLFFLMAGAQRKKMEELKDKAKENESASSSMPKNVVEINQADKSLSEESGKFTPVEAVDKLYKEVNK